MRISAEDNQRIADAVAKAESGTSGEIRCVLAQSTENASQFALSWASGAALILPALALLLGLQPQALSRVFGAWTVAHLAAEDARVASAVASYIVLQAAVFILVWLVASLAAVRRALTPAIVARRRVHEAALAQFSALGLANTRDRTGVLLFASLAERRAEVLADEGVYAKAPPPVWDEVVALLVAGLKRDAAADGFVDAVERTREILASSLPPRPDDRNELPNSLTETP